ncbi:nucleotide sugar dehydrogenase [Cytobacillus sp. NCCP-133]|uniref:nucleotide sugar dehydrogenase n=1 Tax=Cytobacillus sp. NCCP-133 TaxID=766848 RepID=UPI00222EE01F|nr:nucleotide sugar dehydrogenase [Cytobacillus sp. NCCP-133]GLB58980.1 UDP-N-acetyl-D-mannosamine dehydrogenase [Cytobacillus sp. NCCP-133]
MKKICVVGLGYIGLPTSAMFAKTGFEVVGVDINENAVSLLNRGEIHIEELGLGELVKKVVREDRLRAATLPEHADVFIIAVPTPNYPDHTANLEYVKSATESILPFLKKGDVVIVESTIPPRTIDDFVAPIIQAEGWNVGVDIFLAHCPERVLPGRILIELVENTRIVGGINDISAQKAAQVYNSFVTGEIIVTSAVTAEMSKLMENTYRDVNIALANELAKISDKLGINALEVIELANRHPRVNLHQPGPGVGGHCLAVDPYFIIEKAPDESPLIINARRINNSMPEFVIRHVDKIVESGGKIAVFGLTYKGNIDDIRESPAMDVLSLLQERNYNLSIYDPHVKQAQVNFKLSTFDEAIDQADCILILTDHNEFKGLDEVKIHSKMRNPVIFDTKNCTNINSEAIKYYNYGNLYEMSRKVETLV